MLRPNAATVKKIGHLLLIVALLGATGGHWAVLQTIAWANMLSQNLQSDSVATAISKTFDGAHPCKMCQRIAAGKQDEKKADLPLQVKKLEFVTDRPILVFSAPTDFCLVQVTTHSPDGLTHRPAVPPPRTAAV